MYKDIIRIFQFQFLKKMISWVFSKTTKTHQIEFHIYDYENESLIKLKHPKSFEKTCYMHTTRKYHVLIWILMIKPSLLYSYGLTLTYTFTSYLTSLAIIINSLTDFILISHATVSHKTWALFINRRTVFRIGILKLKRLFPSFNWNRCSLVEWRLWNGCQGHWNNILSSQI